MPFTVDEIIKITKLISLLQQGAVELGSFIARLREQGGETTEQILTHAEEANQKAKELIDSL